MGKTTKNKKTDIWILMLGILAGMLVCAALLTVVGLLLVSGRIGEERVSLLSSTAVLFSSLIANLLSGKMYSNTVSAVLISSVVLILMMLMGGWLIDGSFENMPLQIAMVIIGGVVACMICLKRKDKRWKKKRPYR